jgi:hypothetical protein
MVLVLLLIKTACWMVLLACCTLHISCCLLPRCTFHVKHCRLPCLAATVVSSIASLRCTYGLDTLTVPKSMLIDSSSTIGATGRYLPANARGMGAAWVRHGTARHGMARHRIAWRHCVRLRLSEAEGQGAMGCLRGIQGVRAREGGMTRGRVRVAVGLGASGLGPL